MKCSARTRSTNFAGRQSLAEMSFTRFLFAFSAAVLLGACIPRSDTGGSLPPAEPEKLPRWKGFNLDAKYRLEKNRPFSEEDFQIIHELGFNFVRLPMDYRIWIKNGDWEQINEEALKDIDQAVEWGRKYGVHVSLNFHRAPGYTVAKPEEPRSLWTDPEAQRICAKHWAAFARRYKGIPSSRLSFNLFNEPRRSVDPADYAKVVGLVSEAIRKEDPDRLIIADGLQSGYSPCYEIVPCRVAEATRGYQPMAISHYGASWIKGSEDLPPAWPLVQPDGKVIDREWLWKTQIAPWQKLEQRGVGVMVGEWGVFNKTPHDVTLRYMEDSLRNYQQAGWGWALWNFSGPFGIFNSDRKDVAYEDYRGRKLDRQMLELLQKY